VTLVQILNTEIQKLAGHGGIKGYYKDKRNVKGLDIASNAHEEKKNNKYYEENKTNFGRLRWVDHLRKTNGKQTFQDSDGSV
uniref:Uncharacterized protein n=1 Tax=Callithrix jacchus TaxID=9483 RepID=A0A5F4WA16_CALJA